MDADKAGAEPTPTPTAQAAESLATPPVAPSAPDPTPIPVSGPSDGRTVALAPAQAIATGGDTLLGRVLARAWLAGDNRAPLPAAREPLPATREPLPASTRSDGVAARSDLVGGAPPKTVDAFLEAFTTALARADAPRTDQPGAASPAQGPDAAALPSLPGASVAPALPAAPAPQTVPFAIPVAHDAAPVTPPAPAPSLPQAPQVDPHAVVEQVLRAMAIQTADGTSTVRMRLVPEHLGDVSVKLIVSGGAVDATLTAHSVDAQNALVGGQTQLAKTLADAGLKLQSFNVGLAGGGGASTGDRSDGRRSASQSTVRRIGGVAVADGDEEADPTLLAVPSFAPPVFAPSGAAGALNYLV